MYTLNEAGKVDIKQVRKGAQVTLRNGFTAIVEDNQVNRTTRLCTVHGYVTEMGSVYSTDIQYVWFDGRYVEVQHTRTQNRITAMLDGARRACDSSSELYHSM